MTEGDSERVLARLTAGNRRFVAGRGRHPHQRPARRRQVAAGQHPVAAVVACADSRVPPEILFDCGLGDLFVVRVAGNIASQSVTGSIEYAVEHLGVPLVVVLGHTRCGAVTAAVEGGHAPGHVPHVLCAIQPAVACTSGWPGDPVDNAARAHVGLVTAQLRASEPVLADRVRQGALRLVGAYYHLDTGEAEIL